MNILRNILLKLKHKDVKINFLAMVFLSISAITLAIFIGIRRTPSLSFYPINGDFQSYNMFRRFVDGQIPYKDFVVYLGLGPMYLGSFFVVFSNSLYGSMVSSEAISILIFICTIWVVLYVFSKNIKSSFFLSLGLMLLIYAYSQYFGQIITQKNPDNLFIEIFNKLMIQFRRRDIPGNSIRTWRNFIVVIVSFVLLPFLKNSKNKLRSLLKNVNIYIKSIVCGYLASPIIAWSNDYGVSAFIAISFCFFLWLINNYKIKYIVFGTLLYSLASVASLSIFINVLTSGSFVEWVKYTLSVSQYQSWYFGFDKNLSFLTTYYDLFTIIYIITIIYHIVVILKVKNVEKTSRNYVLLFMLLSNFIGSYIYHIMGAREDMLTYMNYFIYLLFFLSIIDWIYRGAKNSFKKTNYKIIYVFCICFLMFTAFVIYDTKQNNNNNNDNVQFIGGRINGYIPDNSQALLELDKIIDDSSYFSTYASALEAMNDDFQPTRFDYIIHVLGDSNRKEYLDNFTEGNYKYVLTIDNDYASYENWIQNANWFFYRNVYENYFPIKKTGYNVLWEKNEKKTRNIDDCEIEWHNINQNTVEIYIETNDSESYIADIKLDYAAIPYSDDIFTIIHHSMVRVQTDNDLSLDPSLFAKANIFNIPKKSKEYYVPLYIHNGKGHMKLTYIPTGYGKLTVNDIEVMNLFKDIDGMLFCETD